MGKLEKSLHSFLLTIIFITSSIMIIGVIIQVILRSFFDVSLTWMEELSRYMFVWSAFMGAVIASRDKLHPKMDLIVDNVPIKIRKYYQLLLRLFILFFLAYMTYAGFKLVASPSVFNQESTNLRIPMYVMYAVIPISSILMFLYEAIGIKEIFSNKELRESN